MAEISVGSGTLDYTVDIASLVTAINALTTKLNTINTTLLANNVLLVAALDAITVTTTVNFTPLIEAMTTNTTSIDETLTALTGHISLIKERAVDPTKGIHIVTVDLPYQGIYQRALSRQSLTDGGLIEKLPRVIQEEKQSPIFSTNA
jgi:hypothetical protein